MVGCYFDRRQNVAQVYVNGALSEEVSLRKLFKYLGFKFDVEAANPCVCLSQQGDAVGIEFARIVPIAFALSSFLRLLARK